MSENTLPSSWADLKLGELISEGSYGTSAKTGSDASGVPVLRMGNIISGKLDFAQLKYLPADRDEFPNLLLSPGDVLFNRTNSAELVGKTAVYRGVPAPCSFASYLIRIRLTGVLPDWVSLYLNSPLGRACISEVVSQQVGQANVNGTKLKGFTIPLPPLNEQKRIVAKIEELFSELEAGEESLRLARRQLGVYRQSLLKQAFEGRLTAKWRALNPDKVESSAALLIHIQSDLEWRYEQQSKDWNALRLDAKPKKPAALKLFPKDELVGNFPLPANWLVLRYGDLCSVIRNGISRKPSGETGHKIARISAVRPMIFDYEDYRFIDCDDAFAADFTLARGDLLFTRYNGARRFVGVCAQFNWHEPRLYPDKLIRTRPDLPSLDPRYLEFALNFGLSRAWLETKIRTTAGQSGVSGGDVKEIPAPLCSLPEQREIVRLLDAQFEIIERNEREIDDALRKSEALRQAILKKAFTGRLVPQDPADEPASVLLARLRAEREKGAAIPVSPRKKRMPSTSHE